MHAEIGRFIPGSLGLKERNSCGIAWLATAAAEPEVLP